MGIPNSEHRLLDAFLTGAGSRTEHNEIAAYEGLVTMAQAMGETEVVELLTENLDQEKAALEKLQTIGTRLAREGASSSRVSDRSTELAPAETS